MTNKTIAGMLLVALAVLALAATGAPAAPLFPQCPPVGNNDGCSQLVVAKRAGRFVVKSDPNAPRLGFDGAEDTLVGIQNNSGRPLSAVNLASTTLSIFGFDGDGLCNPSQWPQAPATTPPGCPGPQGFGPTGYEGPGTAFSNVSANQQTGTLTFAQPLAPGGSAYFGLEEALEAGQLRGGAAGHPIAAGLRVKRSNVASFQLTCAGVATCRGKAVIVVGARVFAPAGSTARTRRVVVGSAGVSIPGGETRQLSVRLNAQGRSLLGRTGHFLARLTVVLRQGARRQTTLVGKLRFRRHRRR